VCAFQPTDSHDPMTCHLHDVWTSDDDDDGGDDDDDDDDHDCQTEACRPHETYALNPSSASSSVSHKHR